VYKPTLIMSILLTDSGSRLKSNETTLIIWPKTRWSRKNRSKLWTGSGSHSESYETTLIICKWACKNVYNDASFYFWSKFLEIKLNYLFLEIENDFRIHPSKQYRYKQLHCVYFLKYIHDEQRGRSRCRKNIELRLLILVHHNNTFPGFQH
jgi:hypothetical protein